MRGARGLTAVGVLGVILALTGCDTSGKGGKLPDPGPKKTVDEQKKDFSDMTSKMYGEMAKQGKTGDVPTPYKTKN